MARRSENIIAINREQENRQNAYHNVLKALAEFDAATGQFTKHAELELLNQEGESTRYIANMSDRAAMKYKKLLSDYITVWATDWRLQFLVKEFMNEDEYKKYQNQLNVELEKRFLLLSDAHDGKMMRDICYGQTEKDGINGIIWKLRSDVLIAYEKYK